MTKHDKDSTPVIGLFGIGLDAYWNQFSGLRERLAGYQKAIADRISSPGTLVVDAGLVDSPPKARQASALLAAENVDIVFLYVSTYALSSTVLPVVNQLNKPVVVLNLQPSAAIDYASVNAMGDRGKMTGEWLAHCQACCIPEIASVFKRARIPFRVVTGHLTDETAWSEIAEWLTAARVRKGMAMNRVGLLGHYYCGMLDVYSDLTRQSAVLGNHFEIVEMDELSSLRDGLMPAEIVSIRKRFAGGFDVDPACSEAELDRAACTAAALFKLVDKHSLGSLAYYYEGRPDGPHQDIATSIIPGNTLLTASHVPVAGEYEVKNVQAMKMLDLAGAGGSFSEFYAMDFNDDVVLLGHDGPGHAAIAQDKVRLVPLPVFHGKPGQGLSIQMRVKHGPVTLLSLTQDADGGLGLLVAEGEAVLGPVLEIGNTNSRCRFPVGAKAFVNAWSAAGPAHHCAVGVGRHASWLAKLADLWGIPCRRVC
jgi:L-arabinose isomerase